MPSERGGAAATPAARTFATPDSAGGTPSTLGGPGWTPRTGTHGEEVAAGLGWTPSGYRSEAAPLRAVLLARPPESIARVTDAAAHLMTAGVDLTALRRQAEGVAEAYGRQGITVHVTDVPDHAPPNVVFQRDLFLVTPHGAVVGRTASRQRAGEERYAAAALAAAGVPILHTVRGAATFEGADALWVDDDTLLVGCGFRTNAAGARAVAEVVGEQGARVVTVPVGPGVQHLLGSFVPVGPRRALLHEAASTEQLRGVLRSLDYDVIAFPPDEEVVDGRSLNVVTLRPDTVLMPAGNPRTRRRLEAAGVEVFEAEVGEYVKAAGALGCLTGIVRREAEPTTAGGPG